MQELLPTGNRHESLEVGIKGLNTRSVCLKTSDAERTWTFEATDCESEGCNISK